MPPPRHCGPKPQSSINNELKALFICALVAIKHDAKMKAFYEKLCVAGKKKMAAITAVMRKLLTILNAKSKCLYINQVG